MVGIYVYTYFLKYIYTLWRDWSARYKIDKERVPFLFSSSYLEVEVELKIVDNKSSKRMNFREE